MIIYNVSTHFRAMKADAEAIRKKLGLPPEALNKIVINNREELEAFLTQILAGAIEVDPSQYLGDNEIISEIPFVPAVGPFKYDREAFETLPAFLQRDWEARERNAK